MRTEHEANTALAMNPVIAERARWAAVLGKPSRAPRHYKPAPTPSPVAQWARVAVNVSLFAGVGVLLALGF